MGFYVFLIAFFNLCFTLLSNTPQPQRSYSSSSKCFKETQVSSTEHAVEDKWVVSRATGVHVLFTAVFLVFTVNYSDVP